MKKRITVFILVVCLCLTLLPTAVFADGGVAIDEVNFPDEIFRGYVAENFDTDSDGVLSAAECDNVTEICVDGMGITSLKGIEFFPNLVSLLCGPLMKSDDDGYIIPEKSRYNYLTELDVSHNPKLYEIYCPGNKLTSLDVTKNPELVMFTCYDNEITALDVSKCPKLFRLYCSNNKITSLDASNNPGLTHLSCGRNSIALLDLSNNVKLDRAFVYISDQKIALPQLDGFDLSKLIGADNLTRITSFEGGSLDNGIISCEGNQFSYYYDTESNAGSMQVVLTYDPQSKFTDAVPESHWAHDAIDYVLDRGIMSGTGSNTFEPNGTVTRAMIAVMLYNLSGTEDEPTSNPFTDVPETWYTTSVIWAYENEIVSGNGAGTFDPEGAVTREQLAVMMANYAEFMGKDITADFDLSKFADNGDISDWAVSCVMWACANGIINGSDDDGQLYMNPQGKATRAQIAVIIKNFCETFEV